VFEPEYRIGCTTTLVVSREQAADELFNYSKAEAVIGPVFPFVWVQIRYDPDVASREVIKAKLDSLGLREFSYSESKRHKFLL